MTFTSSENKGKEGRCVCVCGGIGHVLPSLVIRWGLKEQPPPGGRAHTQVAQSPRPFLEGLTFFLHDAKFPV